MGHLAPIPGQHGDRGPRFLLTQQSHGFPMEERMLKFFAYAHLRDDLKAVSMPFGRLAELVVALVPAGPGRWKTMRLHPHEFIRRFLMHVLPKGFHRIRHYGLFANANRAENIAAARALLDMVPPAHPQQSRISRRTPDPCCLARAHAAAPA